MKKAKINPTVLTIIIMVIVAGLVVFGVSRYLAHTNKKSEPPVAEKENIEQTTETATELPLENIEENKEQEAVEDHIEKIEYEAETEVIDLVSPSATQDIITMGNIEFREAQELNEIYTKISILGMKEPLYGYFDKDGNVVLRTYGDRYVKKNNVNTELMTGYFAVELNSTDSGKTTLRPIDPSRPVTDSIESAAIPEREGAAPNITLDESKYIKVEENLYKCLTRKGVAMYRTFATVNGSVYLFDCAENGEIKPGSMPVYYAEDAKNIQLYTEDVKKLSDESSYPVQYKNTKIVLTVKK